MAYSYNGKVNDGDDLSSLQFPDTHGPLSTSYDLLTTKINLDNEKGRLTESNFLKLLSKSEDRHMPMSTVDDKLENKKQEETKGKITINIKFVS